MGFSHPIRGVDWSNSGAMCENGLMNELFDAGTTGIFILTIFPRFDHVQLFGSVIDGVVRASTVTNIILERFLNPPRYVYKRRTTHVMFIREGLRCRYCSKLQ